MGNAEGGFFPYPVLYRSPRFVVIDKPGGLPVHPGPRTGRTLEDALPLLTRRKDGPWLVHRLDADTSGCVLVALRKQALIAAQQAFQSRAASKTYWAIVSGRPQGEDGDVTLALGRRESPRGWRIVPDTEGNPARTQWRLLGTDGALSWLELTLHTGRTHQARVHCAALGTPILGDPVYNPHPGDGPLRLLARHLKVTVDDETIEAVAPPPASMARILSAFR